VGAKTIFDALKKYGHDEDYEPKPDALFFPTMFWPGSDEKIEVLRQRVEHGLPLWHEQDEQVCNVTGVGADKQKAASTYGKTARLFAPRRNKMLSD
jgi:hypothetical protein